MRARGRRGGRVGRCGGRVRRCGRVRSGGLAARRPRRGGRRRADVQGRDEGELHRRGTRVWDDIRRGEVKRPGGADAGVDGGGVGDCVGGRAAEAGGLPGLGCGEGGEGGEEEGRGERERAGEVEGRAEGDGCEGLGEGEERGRVGRGEDVGAGWDAGVSVGGQDRGDGRDVHAGLLGGASFVSGTRWTEGRTGGA